MGTIQQGRIEMARRRGLGRYVRDFFTNWEESDEPIPEKLRLTARNRFIAFGLMRGCCGHYGEPGC
jgi:hypothetical protein